MREYRRTSGLDLPLDSFSALIHGLDAEVDVRISPAEIKHGCVESDNGVAVDADIAVMCECACAEEEHRDECGRRTRSDVISHNLDTSGWLKQGSEVKSERQRRALGGVHALLDDLLASHALGRPKE